MKNRLTVLAAAMLAAGVATGAAAQDSKKITLMEVAGGEAATVTATVTAIAPETRTLLLKGESGKYVSLQVPDAVRNFPQIKVGDIVVARYSEAIAVEVKKPGAASAEVTGAAAKAAPGEKPAGVVASQVKVTVVVKAIDVKKPSVTVQGPEGNLYDVRIKDPKNIEGLKVGDRVEITYTQAFAISVEAAPKAPAAK